MCHVFFFSNLVGWGSFCMRFVLWEVRIDGVTWRSSWHILTCHSSVMGVQRTLPKRLGNLDIVHCYFTGWWFQIWLVKRNRSICLPETNTFPQVHTWAKTRMTWHTCCFILISTSMYGDLLRSAFLRLILVVTNILFHKNFSNNMFFSYELMLHVGLFNFSAKCRSSVPQRGPERKRT